MTTETRVSDIEYSLYHAAEAFIAAFQPYCNSVRCESCLLRPEGEPSTNCKFEDMLPWLVNYVGQIDYKRADSYGVRIGPDEFGKGEYPKGRWRTIKEIPFVAIYEIFNCKDTDIKVIPYFD